MSTAASRPTLPSSNTLLEKFCFKKHPRGDQTLGQMQFSWKVIPKGSANKRKQGSGDHQLLLPTWSKWSNFPVGDAILKLIRCQTKKDFIGWNQHNKLHFKAEKKPESPKYIYYVTSIKHLWAPSPLHFAPNEAFGSSLKAVPSRGGCNGFYSLALLETGETSQMLLHHWNSWMTKIIIIILQNSLTFPQSTKMGVFRLYLASKIFRGNIECMVWEG